MSFDAHRIFNGSSEPADYLTNLTLSATDEGKPRKAREEIREAIRRGLGDWDELITKRELFDVALMHVEPPKLRPKFRMQGSFAYRTCNRPAQCPPQEIDLDDGLFLPISYLTGNGLHHPAVVSEGLFRAVEQALEPLCESRGWTLNKDKSSCVRVELDEGAHVDIALYAISDADYTVLLEKAAHTVGSHNASQAYRELAEARDLTDELYEGLPSEGIMLAHREDGWKPSDPRKLEDWFRTALETHGEQLRRVCRYLKGWRDHQWNASRIASIALMSAAITAYDEAFEEVPENRDDLAMLMVAERLPSVLSGQIDNPVVDGQRLDEGWSTEQRADFVAEAEVLLERLRHVLAGTDDPRTAIQGLIAAFGPRVPNEPNLIKSEDMRAPSTKSAIGAPAILKSSREQMAASIAELDDADRQRRAEAAAREIESSGSASKPWLR